MKRSIATLLLLLPACGGPTSTEGGEAKPADTPTPRPEPQQTPLELAQAACLANPACTADGRCSAKPGADAGSFTCVAGSVHDCRASANCKASAACSLDQATGACTYVKASDCYYTDACLHDGKCFGSKPGDTVVCKGEGIRIGVSAGTQHYDTLEFDGALDVDMFRASVSAHIEGIRACRVEALGVDKSDNGLAKIAWTITPDGAVANLKVAADGLGSPAYAACLLQEIDTWEFAASADGVPINVVLGFSFSR